MIVVALLDSSQALSYGFVPSKADIWPRTHQHDRGASRVQVADIVKAAADCRQLQHKAILPGFFHWASKFQMSLQLLSIGHPSISSWEEQM